MKVIIKLFFIILLVAITAWVAINVYSLFISLTPYQARSIDSYKIEGDNSTYVLDFAVSYDKDKILYITTPDKTQKTSFSAHVLDLSKNVTYTFPIPTHQAYLRYVIPDYQNTFYLVVPNENIFYFNNINELEKINIIGEIETKAEFRNFAFQQPVLDYEDRVVQIQHYLDDNPDNTYYVYQDYGKKLAFLVKNEEALPYRARNISLPKEDPDIVISIGGSKGFTIPILNKCLVGCHNQTLLKTENITYEVKEDYHQIPTGRYKINDGRVIWLENGVLYLLPAN